MQPDDIPVHDLLGVANEPEPGPDELRAIVARASRKRWATVGIAAALALGLGLGVGYGTSGQSSSTAGTATASGSPASGSTGGGGSSVSAGAAVGYGGASSSPTPRVDAAGVKMSSLFARPSNGVTTRAFVVTFPQINGLPPGCGLQGPRLQAEVSTAKMVGIVEGGIFGVDRTQPVSGVTSQIVGSAEGDPTAVVIAATGPSVSHVSMSFPGGTKDQMAPVEGWVVLTAPVSKTLSYGQSLGMLTANNAHGGVLKSQALKVGVASATTNNIACGYGCPAGAPAAGSATSSGGKPVVAPATPAIRCMPVPCTPVPGVSPLPPVTSGGPQTGGRPPIRTVKPGIGGPAIACVAHSSGSSASGSAAAGSRP
jgi:hypothetical protein